MRLGADDRRVHGVSFLFRALLPPSEQPLPARPNILWIICEDTSPYLGCYADPHALTPNINRFAGQAILYTNAFATAPVCSPSRSCLITGVYATSLGTQNLRSDVRIPRQVEPLPKRLRVAGYYCSNNFKEDYNFKDSTIWDDSSPTAHWRNRIGGVPFFSVFNLLATHQGQINGSDEEFFQKYGSKLKPEERHNPQSLTLPPFYPDTPMVRKMWARYYDLVTYVDKQVGELLQQLEADGLAESTIVFIFSDHGLRPAPVQAVALRHRPAGAAAGARPGPLPALCVAGTGRANGPACQPRRLRPHRAEAGGSAGPGPHAGPAVPGPRTPSTPREYIYGAASRVDEAYDMSRCVRDKRYKYIRNFMPHLPYVQPSDYPDQAEIMQELRRVAREGGLAGIEKLYWEPTKPLEELYDTLTDPNRGQEPGRRARSRADAQPHEKTALGLDGSDEGHRVAAGSGDAHPGRRLDAV